MRNRTRVFSLLGTSTLLLSCLLLSCVLGIARQKNGLQKRVSGRATAAPSKPNGRIAFTSFRDRNSEIYTMNGDGSGVIRLTNNAAFDGQPRFSPDGTRIVFMSTRDGNEEIYVMSADGSGLRRLTINSALDREPVWSPDGTQIAFASNRDSGTFDIFVMDADGRNQVNISKGVSTDFQDPDWSPEGVRIACEAAQITNGVLGNSGVVLMNTDGSNQIRISQDVDSDFTPRWSPDASKLAFSSHRFGDFGSSEIYVMTPLGTNQTRLTNNFNENSRPVWSPDGTKIAFQGDPRIAFDIFVINSDGSAQIDLTDNLFDEFSPSWGFDTSTPFNPIDDPVVFVRQHYLDFLNREPDPGGLAYWSGQIESCGTDPVCIHERRIGVSASFVLSPEFEDTGFFIEKLYNASFCRRPLFAEFQADRTLVVAGPDLEQTKQSFTLQFVQRNEFNQKYPSFLIGSGFVDAVIDEVRSCIGVDLSPQRGDLINAYNQSTNTAQSRANVMRAVVDNTVYSQAEFNEAFVLMEYFGYLRRNPDIEGFQFWLDVLNNRVPNNYRAMVCGFITSREYQLRFGPVQTHSNVECSP